MATTSTNLAAALAEGIKSKSPVMEPPARKKAAADQAAKRVTFGKTAGISNMWDDDRATPVLVDGKEVGEIVAHMVPVGLTTKAVRIGSYELTPDVWEIDGVTVKARNVDVLLQVRRPGQAKKSLENAKRFAIDTVANAMMRAGTDEWTG